MIFLCAIPCTIVLYNHAPRLRPVMSADNDVDVWNYGGKTCYFDAMAYPGLCNQQAHLHQTASSNVSAASGVNACLT